MIIPIGSQSVTTPERPYANMKGTHVQYEDFLGSCLCLFRCSSLSRTRELLSPTHTLMHLMASMITELGTIGALLLKCLPKGIAYSSMLSKTFN